MEPLEPTDPRTLGPFRVDGRIGVGGMGQVYGGTDQNGRRVALKMVHTELAGDPGFRERFRREIRMATAAPSWFTAPVVGADPDAERPWLATEFIDGPSLQGRVEQQGPLGLAEVAAMGSRLAAGLAVLHAGGLVHRDLKPSNVLLAAQGPRLIDFGIARAADTSTITRTGQFLGTPMFMSPEQASGARDLGSATDVFSLGALLVYAATGQSPFAAETLAASIYKIANAQPDLGKLTQPLRNVVAACLGKAPAARPTAAQVRDALASGLPLAPTSDAPTDRTPASPNVGPQSDASQNPGPQNLGPENPKSEKLRPGNLGPQSRPSQNLGPQNLGPNFASQNFAAQDHASQNGVTHDVVPHDPATQPRRIPGSQQSGPHPPGPQQPGFYQSGTQQQGPYQRGPHRSGPQQPGSGTQGSRPRRTLVWVAAVVVLAVALAGAYLLLSGSERGPDDIRSDTTVDAMVDSRFGSGDATFVTPSGNITCRMTPQDVRCDVAERTWQVPTRPSTCRGTWATGTEIIGAGAGSLSCIEGSDPGSLARPSTAQLAYGEAVRLGNLTCVSRQTGVRCENATTLHGFSISRASYELF